MLLEAMEPRALFSDTPLPLFSDFEDASNPAIRLTTSFGDIDMELFRHEAPELVDAFIAGLERGLSADQTFFHRLVPGVVLQGGLFAFDPGAGIGAIPSNQPIDEPVGVGRQNTERTLAMGSLFDSGPLSVSSFIFNLRDNSGSYDPAEVVVFGRVIDDRSWAVVQEIASLDVADLASDTGFAGFFAGSFHSVPVTAPYTPPEDGDPGTVITPELLAPTYDLSIIRAAGADDMYRYTMYEPEGFLSASIREFIPIENPNDVPVYFELNARFEPTSESLTLFRDDLVFRGMIPANSRGGVTIRLGDHTVSEAIRTQDAPFALELRSTLPLAASLSHYDFGSTIAMAFEDDLATTWTFPRTVKAADVSDFLVWYNPSDETGDVTLTFIDENGTELAPIVFSIDRYRRGGINFSTTVAIPDGVYTVRVDSTVALAVSRSHYATPPGQNTPEGYSEIGSTGEPSTIGIVPIAADAADAPFRMTSWLNVSFYNPGTTDAVIDLNFYAPGATAPGLTFPAALTVPAGQSRTFDPNVPQEWGDVYSLVYSSTEPVFGSFSMFRTEATYGGAISVVAAEDFHFAEGFLDPGRARPHVLEESIHLFNANGTAFGVPDTDADVTITFRFTNGETLSINRTVAGGTLERIQVSTLTELRDYVLANEQFFYSIEVESSIPIVAQMMHTDVNLGQGTSGRGGGFVLAGTTFGETRRLDDPGPL